MAVTTSPTGRPLRRMMTGLLAVAIGAIPSRLSAQSSRLPPVIDAMTAPYTENELGGIGCLAGTVVAGGVVMAVAGGGAIMAALQGPISPIRVVEGGAALAFLLSSACYVGQALTPVTMLGWSSIMDALPQASPPR